uniref:Putative E3 ubiquitin-protein ligase HERC2 n=1 Tax=Anthurium amnicola TaxID=1678845 RepID=A0A1D1Y8M3_9ARAE
MAQKVIEISAGEAHTIALTGDGSVFAWGRGTFGRLGTGKEVDELYPVPVRFDLSEKGSVTSVGGERGKPRFVAIAAGAYHCLALQDDGSVWSWGYNIYGQLGQGEENSLVPCLVEQFLELGPPGSLTDETNANHEKVPLKVSSVKAGGMMSLVIDGLGALWIWGNCPQHSSSSDGEFSFASSSVPLPVWDFHGHTVVKVACGNEHVVALVTAGETFTGGDLLCYSWGNNNRGQLGQGDYESRARPQILSTFNEESPWAVYEIACGAFHTALLTQRKFSEEEIGCKCWTFGLGDNGQLGQGASDNCCLPEPVDGLPPEAILISVDCGLFHTSVVSSAGDVWSWGMEKGLGLCPDASFLGNNPGDALVPLRILPDEGDGVRFPGPVQVACGAAHTVLVASDGYKLWAWGRGRSGVLGRGHLADSFVPCAVMWPPLVEDFKAARAGGGKGEVNDNGSKQIMEMNHKLSAALEDVSHLRSKLAILQRYAGVLHAAVFGTMLQEQHLPRSLEDANSLDIRKQLQQTIDLADYEELGRMESFYRNMLSRVKDKRMKIRVQEFVRDSFLSLSARSQTPSQ